MCLGWRRKGKLVCGVEFARILVLRKSTLPLADSPTIFERADEHLALVLSSRHILEGLIGAGRKEQSESLCYHVKLSPPSIRRISCSPNNQHSESSRRFPATLQPSLNILDDAEGDQGV
jgi:hypothetical protein